MQLEQIFIVLDAVRGEGENLITQKEELKVRPIDFCVKKHPFPSLFVE